MWNKPVEVQMDSKEDDTDTNKTLKVTTANESQAEEQMAQQGTAKQRKTLRKEQK
jgi:hypothetical protein